jgi:hypothetical protein
MLYALLALVMLAFVGPAHAQIHVDIGIHLPAPPPLVVVPTVASVQYAPSAPGNFFFYGGQYWVFTGGGWHVSRGFNGPWILVAPQYVPRPVLLVPVRYYHVPPGHWAQWQREAPPHWEHEWGHGWAEKRGWKERGNDNRGWNHQEVRTVNGPGRGDDHGPGNEHGHGNGHGNDGPGKGHGKGK